MLSRAYSVSGTVACRPLFNDDSECLISVHAFASDMFHISIYVNENLDYCRESDGLNSGVGMRAVHIWQAPLDVSFSESSTTGFKAWPCTCQYPGMSGFCRKSLALPVF